MSLLSEKNIQHSILLKSNVRLNEFLLPKICFYAAERANVFRDPSNLFRGSYNETVLDSTSNVKLKDVFLYSLIMYEIVTKKKPFKKLTSSLATDFINGHRPHFGEKVSHKLKKLIKKCWSADVSKRPSFNEIVEKLKKQEYLLEDVVKDAYYEYARLIDEYQDEVK